MTRSAEPIPGRFPKKAVQLVARNRLVARKPDFPNYGKSGLVASRTHTLDVSANIVADRLSRVHSCFVQASVSVVV